MCVLTVADADIVAGAKTVAFTPSVAATVR